MGFLERLHRRAPPRAPPHAPATGAAQGVQLSPLPPLALSRREFQELIDRSWSRRDRWRNLEAIVALAATHHPNDGQLPALVRAYVERNLLQPYFPAGAPDARFWIVLGLASDHADVLRFVSRYVDEHPGTRTATEMLFLLDELVEASRDAFHLLRLTPIDELKETRRQSPEHFALAERLQAGYIQWAVSRRLWTNEDIDARAEDIRVRVLTAIIETSPDGYGANDARFLIGRARWTSGDPNGAAVWWGQMGSDARDGDAEVRSDIARALRDGGDVDGSAVATALDKEYKRWLRGATQRLATFGFTPTTY